MTLREELEAIRDKHGYLDPEIVLTEASAKNHPLHGRFEWDDKIAGSAWRREQAHQLIRSVRIKYAAPDGRPKDTRAFLAVPRSDPPRPEYVPVENVMRDDFSRRIVLLQMEREWRTLQARYGDLVEFGDLVRATLVKVS